MTRALTGSGLREAPHLFAGEAGVGEEDFLEELIFQAGQATYGKMECGMRRKVSYECINVLLQL